MAVLDVPVRAAVRVPAGSPRPEEVEGRKVPAVLLSGDHARIARWRYKQALGRSFLRRPDLVRKLKLDSEQKRLLDEFLKEQ